MCCKENLRKIIAKKVKRKLKPGILVVAVVVVVIASPIEIIQKKLS